MRLFYLLCILLFSIDAQPHIFKNSPRVQVLSGKFAPFLAAIIPSVADVDKIIAQYPEMKKGRDFYQYTFRGTPRCAAFFVSNSKGTLILASARHCMNYDEQKWCAENSSVRAYLTGFEGTCKRIITTLGLDMFLFEADFGENLELVSQYIRPLDITVFNSNTPLHLSLDAYGFPSDMDGAAVHSNNCWTKSAAEDPDYKNVYWNDTDKETAETWRKWIDIQMPLGNKTQPPYVRHNCSIYGGNSGGPIILSGTFKVIGMPATFDPRHHEYGSESYGFLETPEIYDDSVAKILTEEGIVIDHLSDAELKSIVLNQLGVRVELPSDVRFSPTLR